MTNSFYSESAHTADTEPAARVDPSPANSGLPNRLLTAFEVAEYVGCHEETVRRAYLRGLLRAEASCRDAGPRWCASTRLAMLPNRCCKRESHCLLLPRVALSNLGPPRCDSLHRSGLRVLLAVP